MGTLNEWLKTAPDHELQAQWNWWKAYGTWHNEAWYRACEEEMKRREKQRTLKDDNPRDGRDAVQRSQEVTTWSKS